MDYSNISENLKKIQSYKYESLCDVLDLPLVWYATSYEFNVPVKDWNNLYAKDGSITISKEGMFAMASIKYVAKSSYGYGDENEEYDINVIYYRGFFYTTTLSREFLNLNNQIFRDITHTIKK